MNYRIANIEIDKSRIDAFCEKHGLSVSSDAVIWIAENENNEIAALGAIRLIAEIQPLISKNSVAAYKIFKILENSIRNSRMPVLRCLVEKENQNLVEKLGFERVFEEHSLMEKFIGDN